MFTVFSNKYEEAAELLEACNNYKLAKAWGKAAEGFELLADCHLKSDSKHDAATACVRLHNAHKKVNPAEAVRCLLTRSDTTPTWDASPSPQRLKDVAGGREKRMTSRAPSPLTSKPPISSPARRTSTRPTGAN